MPCLLPVPKPYHLFNFSMNLESEFILLFPLMQITLMPSRLHSIQSSISGQSILKKVCHLIEEIFKTIFSYSPMSHQFANIFTKAMTRDSHPFLISKLMLVDPHQYEGKYEGT